MAAVSLEERVTAVESELARLTQRLESVPPQPSAAWWKKIVGVHKDDPEFEEAMRLGREYRASLRPKHDGAG